MSKLKDLCAVCPRPDGLGQHTNKEDWPVHSTVCKQFAKLGDRPSFDMIRVIYFPADDTEPEFKWVPIKVAEDPTGHRSHEAPEWEGKDSYGSSASHYSVRRCDEKCRGDYHKKGCYTIWINTLEDDEANEFEWANDCVKELTEDLNTTWKGPILAYGTGSLGSHHDTRHKAIDLDTTDLKVLALDFFQVGSRERSVKAVQINCIGHMKRYEAPEFESKVVDRRQLRLGYHCQIPKMIGLPLVLYHTQTDNGLDTHSVKASLLKMECSLNSVRWGHYSRKTLGNMVVVHDHGKHISPHIVQALCVWIDKGLRPFFNLTRKLNRNDLKLIDKSNVPQREEVTAKMSARHDRTIEKISKDKYLEYHKGRMDNEDSTDEDMPDDYSAEEESEDEDDGAEE
ncbi:hypothetical protein D6C87_05490 [Aureobasidium pullulans]|uniref:MYND-type zinc finger protein samB n=2 Tax=Aureobasidium pullulans TaxID=5580 RepID=A0AB38M8V3_AURPU|nr:hypothetical protein D6D08_06454 [Aureobasidium pullulans]THY78851.1 hypothetical protein D6C94_00923 [Aureobasidium pullulans]THZ41784.1 hypothetical protein D6C87_05490 [Aureobasidium pullulans]